MGDQQISPLTSQAKKAFLRELLDDISALEQMIESGMIESGKTRIGAEQEYCLVGHDLRPKMAGHLLLPKIEDPHFTAELAKWNLEINLDPQDAGPGCLARMDAQLMALLDLAHRKADEIDSKVILTGMLPTIRKSDLDFNNMTPNPRYQVIDNILKELRGEDFYLNIEGVDEVNLKADSILFEACNTSFQIHLQVSPEEFADKYNWAQVLAGPVLACCGNSPMLFGKELWNETRIALFRQSLDIRHAGKYVREKEPRVAFGHQWLKDSVVEIFKHDVAIYKLIIATEIEQNSLASLNDGKIPELRAMNVHNGTLYKWNRACYGIGGGIPHLRIENRYIPSGPTAHDEMANTAFWVGLMVAMPEECRGAWDKYFHFRDVRHNFLQAAQHGLANEFSWMGRSVPASNLILEQLLPLAETGLRRIGVPFDEYHPYLSTIEQRVRARLTGADWIVKSFRRLREKNSASESLLVLTEQMHKYGREGTAGHLWPDPDGSVLHSIPGRYDRVDSIMVTDVLAVREDDLMDYAKSLMDWYGYHHLPVESSRGQVRGVITAVDIAKYESGSDEEPLVSDCMSHDVLTIGPEISVAKAEKIMVANQIGSLPVVRDDRVIGIVTANDIRVTKAKLEQSVHEAVPAPKSMNDKSKSPNVQL